MVVVTSVVPLSVMLVGKVVALSAMISDDRNDDWDEGQGEEEVSGGFYNS